MQQQLNSNTRGSSSSSSSKAAEEGCLPSEVVHVVARVQDPVPMVAHAVHPEPCNVGGGTLLMLHCSRRKRQSLRFLLQL
mmetsp:Transcript_72966/g.141155  ORF Transcript_72966/g.141155 Transcript_72966/m.141155 type:complete len:80 (+) Transcript_72966:147-386(+)